MTAAELNALAVVKAAETATYVGLTEQATLTGRVYEQSRSWEPAARHYRDLTDEEKERIG